MNARRTHKFLKFDVPVERDGEQVKVRLSSEQLAAAFQWESATHGSPNTPQDPIEVFMVDHPLFSVYRRQVGALAEMGVLVRENGGYLMPRPTRAHLIYWRGRI